MAPFISMMIISSKQHLKSKRQLFFAYFFSNKLRLIPLSFGHLLLHNSNVLLNEIENKKKKHNIHYQNPPSDYNKCKNAFEYFSFRKSWSNIEFCILIMVNFVWKEAFAKKKIAMWKSLNVCVCVETGHLRET